MESSSVKKASKQACDNCRRRKLKCNRTSPCDKCHNALLSCTYSDVLQRKGPKVRSLGALSSLRPSSSSSASASSPSDFGGPGQIANDVVRNVTSGHPHDVDLAPSTSTTTSTAIISATLPTTSHPACIGLENNAQPPFTNSLLPASISSPVETSFASPTQPPPCGPVQAQGRLSSLVLLAHVNVFLKYLFPIMPVFQADEVLRDSANPEELSPPKYAFLVALCAATHIQLKLDGNERTDVTEDGMRPEGQALMSGDSLLAEAVRARQQYDPIEYSNIDNLLTSFFLFCAYGNLDQQNYAWFYLSQAVALANTLGLHREATYAGLNSTEAERTRRIFWLLFVTERAYALQQNKPIMLRSSIRKPEVFDSDDPILSYGFLNLINLFEKLTVDLYDWISTGSEDGLSGITLTGSIQGTLCSPISLDGVLETQQVDILITQQWLQAVMWRLAVSRSLQKSSGNDGLLPFHFPVTVGKSALSVLSSVSQASIDAHGIGMEQKLFDIGTCVGDVARSLRSTTVLRIADSTFDPKELLWGILTSLSNIRGSQSYLFPALLERSGTVLGLESPQISKSPSLSPAPPAMSSSISPLDTLCMMNAAGVEGARSDYRQFFALEDGSGNAGADQQQQQQGQQGNGDDYDQQQPQQQQPPQPNNFLTKSGGKGPIAAAANNIFLQNLMQGAVTTI